MSAPSATVSRASVVLAHDYLIEAGGAERVVTALADRFPAALLLTSAVRTSTLDPVLADRDIQTSPLGHLLAHKGRARALFPLLPLVFATMGVPRTDVLLTSSSGFAHHLRPRPGTLHAWYCHTPPRFLWDGAAYFRDRPRLGSALEPALALLRRWDRSAAGRVDLIIANSHFTAARIRAVYGRDAEVLWPPVPVDRFTPTLERTGRLLVLSRLLGYKRIELAIAAAAMAGLPLDIVGEGPDRARLERLAGPGVSFLGRLPDAQARGLLARCTALLVPGVEDFGITIVEAQASGRPPIVLATGGALDSVVDGVNGHHVADPDAAAFAAAIDRATTHPVATGALVAAARRMDTPVFLGHLEAILGRALAVAPSRSGQALGARG